MVKKELMKMAIVAGASYALKYKEEHPKADESEVMGKVTKEINQIISKLDEE
ncbi:MAG: hypothetical protein AABY15_07910 [Nanoarchaeota archaeon]